MILVTGGTGLVGSHLLYKLTQQNEKVRAIYREQSRIDKTKKIFSYYHKNWQELFTKIEWIEAELTNVPQLEIAFKEVTSIYHCAAYISFNPKDYSRAKKTNSIGTANLVNLSLALGINSFCHVSSIATLDENPRGVIDESANWTPEKNKHNIYAITKYQSELEVWRGTQEGLNAIIVNPGVIIGPGFWNSGSGKLFTQIAKKGKSYYTNGSVGFIDVNDVVNSMITLTNKKCFSERFILISENTSYHDFVTWVAEALKLKKKPKELSKKELYWLWRLDSVLSFFKLKQQQLFRTNYFTAFKELKYDNQKIKDVVDINFLTTKESIKRTLRHYY